jgi:predicted DNA-binding transcriptional regulator AlpA
MLEQAMAEQQQQKFWLTKHEIALDLGVHINTVPRLVREGRLPAPVRFGPTMVRWSASEYRAWRERQLEARDRELEAS